MLQIPALSRRLGAASRLTTPRVASAVLGCVSIAFAVGAISGAYGWFMDGVTEFETGRTHRYMLPVPVFIIMCTVTALLLGTLSALAWKATRTTRQGRD